MKTIAFILALSASAYGQYAASASGSTTAAAEINGKASINYAAGGGTAQAQTATFSPAPTSLVDGLPFCWKPTAANTAAAPTFSPNGLTAHPIVKIGGAALVANDLITTQHACVIYNLASTNWELQNPQTALCTATAPAHSATPTFSLAGVCRIEPGAMTANVTSVTFSNKSAGAKFSIAWLQDGTGGRTVAYGASASNTCTVDPTANITTTQFFEVGQDGTTVNGTGCVTNSTGAESGPESAAPGTPAASTWFRWIDSTSHLPSWKTNNSAAVYVSVPSTVTFPATTMNVARTDAANTFTGVQTMTSPVFVTPALGTPASGVMTNVTGVPNAAVLATPVPTPGTSITLTAPRGYAICTGTCTVTVPVPAAGYEFCIMNDDNVATAITLSALGSSAMYENSARTAYGTAGTGTLVLAAAAANKVCIVGRDATHYLTVSNNGGAITVN